MQNHYTFNRNEQHLDVNYTNYYWFEQGFTSEELVRIENLTSNLEWETAATGQDDKTKVSNYRKSKIKWCPQNDEWSWVYSKLRRW